MSTSVTSNVSDGTLSIPTAFVTNGSAKAWANYSGVTVTIRDSLNTSSIVDNGAGLQTTSYTSSMVNIFYSLLTGASSPGDTGMLVKVLGQATGSCQFFHYTGSNNGLDNSNFSFGVQGDLA